MILTLTLQELGDVTVFRCAGRITAENADYLRHALLSQRDMHTAVLDLAEVTAIDAGGLGALVALRQWARATGKQLKLMNLRPVVAEVFQVTNLGPAFELCSVSDMLDLMCRAAEQSRLAAADDSSRAVQAS